MSNWQLENYYSNQDKNDNNNKNRDPDNPIQSNIQHNKHEFDQDSGAMRIDSRMTDKSDLSSINFNPDSRNDNEDWFFNQFRQAFNERIGNGRKDIEDLNVI